MKVKRHEETLGKDGYVHYFVCGNGFTYIYSVLFDIYIYILNSIYLKYKSIISQ